MEAESLSRAFAGLSTPLIADAALRLKIQLRISPPGIRPITPNQRLAGQALPVCLLALPIAVIEVIIQHSIERAKKS